ncbi:MAG: universal stress protein, partial [Actinobacteria bacterium]|nr:universal stress protein [Actinomycetota bacterium]
MAGGGVLVALTGAPSSPEVLRRAASLAARDHVPLTGVYVHTPDESTGHHGAVEEQKSALASLGGRYLDVSGED